MWLYSEIVFYLAMYIRSFPKCKGYSEQDKQISSFERAYILEEGDKNKHVVMSVCHPRHEI
jgi:hypothetical protein